MAEPKCARGECDQRIRCAFYCWWKPTMRALEHERRQWDAERAPQPEFSPLGGAARGVGRCVCAAGPGTNPACPVHP